MARQIDESVSPSLDWAPLDELFENHDEFSHDPTEALAGKTLSIGLQDGTTIECALDSETVTWTASRPLAGESSGRRPYRAVAASRPGYYVVTVSHVSSHVSTMTVVDLAAGRVASVATEFVRDASGVRERSIVVQGSIDGAPFEPMPRTDELVGLRVHHRYSTTHAFEHIYVDPDHYMWRGVEGPEVGLGGFEPAEAYAVADELYLFTWHEVPNPFNGAVLIDLRHRRAVGRLFGWHVEKEESMEIPTGSIATVLNRTTYEGL